MLRIVCLHACRYPFPVRTVITPHSSIGTFASPPIAAGTGAGSLLLAEAVLSIAAKFVDGIPHIIQGSMHACLRVAELSSSLSCRARIPHAAQVPNGGHINNSMAQQCSKTWHVHIDELQVFVHARTS